MIAPILFHPGRDTSPMLPAGMGPNMPTLVPAEGRVVPPTGFRPAHRMTTRKSGSAGSQFLGGGRANGLIPASLDDRANDLVEHIADLPERAVGVVVAAADEVSVLHAPSIRMESDHDVQVRYQKSSSDVRRNC